MSDPDRERWTRARHELLDRWRRIVERIDARDEGGTLYLANAMDEFCDEAIRTREAGGPAPARPAGPGTAAAAPDAGTRCLFCRGFIEEGGCFGLLQEINRAVLSRQWDTARCLAEGYIDRLKAMELSAVREARPI